LSQLALSTVIYASQQVLDRGSEVRVMNCSALRKCLETNEYTHQVFAVDQLLAVRCDAVSPVCLQRTTRTWRKLEVLEVDDEEKLWGAIT
jgi:hypothetical protein